MHDLPGRLVVTEHSAVPTSGIDEVGIRGIGSDVAELESSRRSPVAISDLAVIAAAGDGGRAAILLRAVNVIRKMLIGADVIELPGRLVVPGTPRVAAVDADDGSLIDSENHVLRVRRIDPEDVKIVSAWGARPSFEGPAAVLRPVHGSLCHVYEVRILGIDKDAAEVAASHDAGVSVAALPTGATVF